MRNILKTVLLLVTLTFVLGCGSGDERGDDYPAANISGTWTGTSSDGNPLSFTFIHSPSSLTGTASFLGRISGWLSNRTLRIDGTDLVGYLEDDFRTIRGTFTNTSGVAVNFAVTKDVGTAQQVSAPSGGSGSGTSDSSDASDDGSSSDSNWWDDNSQPDDSDDQSDPDDGGGGDDGGPPVPW